MQLSFKRRWAWLIALLAFIVAGLLHVQPPPSPADQSKALPEEGMSIMRGVAGEAAAPPPTASIGSSSTPSASPARKPVPARLSLLRADSGADLYALFKQGAVSTRADERFAAMHVYDLCREYFANMQPPELAQLDQLRWKYLQAARSRMRVDCAHFKSSLLQKEEGLVTGLRESVNSSRDPELALSQGLPRDAGAAKRDAQKAWLRSRILASGADELDLFYLALDDWLQFASAAPSSGISSLISNSPATISMAVNVAICLAGVPCHAESRFATLLCAGTGQLCASDVVVALTSQLPNPADRKVVLDQAQFIVDALAQRQLALLALQ